MNPLDKGKEKVTGDSWNVIDPRPPVSDNPTLIQKIMRVALKVLEELCHSILDPHINLLDGLAGKLWDWTHAEQIPIAAPQNDVLAPVSASGIKVGMPNFIFPYTGNNCWFNSLMKFMASTSYFDNLFEKDDDDDEKRQVRTALKNLFHTLRSADGGIISRTDYLQLLDTMRLVPQYFHQIGHPCDPMDFQMQLFNYLGFDVPNKQKVKIGKEYQNIGPNCARKFGRIDNLPIITLDIPSELRNEDDNLSLTDLFYRPESIEARSDEGSSDLKNYHFNQHIFPIQLPDEIFVYINRLVSDGEQGLEKVMKQISFDDNEEIEFPMYQPLRNGYGNILQFSPTEKTKRYKVTGCIEHIGSARGGHYIAWEKLPGGTVLKHNDTSVAAKRVAIGQNGYLIRLTRI